jgi:hypothetical protein
MGPTNDRKQARELLDKTFTLARPQRLPMPIGSVSNVMTKKHLRQGGIDRRWSIESFFSGLKRTTGSCLLARTDSNPFKGSRSVSSGLIPPSLAHTHQQTGFNKVRPLLNGGMIAARL